ncbi:MAG: hypothetical protein ACW968_04435 [Candidatus Thorarchaeota archaeon]
MMGKIDYGITLTWDEWKTMGLLLAKSRDDLVYASVKTKSTMGKTKGEKFLRPLTKRLTIIDKARSALDDIVFEIFPEKETQALSKVMYPHQDEKDRE